MKTAVTETSIDAYHGLNLSCQQREVVAALRTLGESCIADIAAHLGWQKSTVAGRMNELKARGQIVFVGKRKSGMTGIASEFWKIKTTSLEQPASRLRPQAGCSLF